MMLWLRNDAFVQVVTNPAAQAQGGYWCDVCQCLLKDSLNYLDHINGKRRKSALIVYTSA